MYALKHNKAYQKFHNENETGINKTLENFYSVIKEGFSHGFEAGRETGFTEGVINTNIKMLIRLIENTDLSDEEILRLLNKEGDRLYIQKLEDGGKVESSDIFLPYSFFSFILGT